MLTFLIILTTLLFVALVLVAAMRPPSSPYSLAELERRAKHSVPARKHLERHRHRVAIGTVTRLAQAVIVVAVVLLSVATFGWVIGVIIAVLVVMLYPVIARAPFITRQASLLYEKVEPYVLVGVIRAEPIFRFLRDTPLYGAEDGRQLGSREELCELIADSKEALSSDERLLLTSVLAFKEKKVATVMTPRTVIDFIKKTEFLGPLVLDELHALGHSRLPVIDEDLNHIVGILYLRDMLSLDVKKSTTAEKAMEPQVFYIHQDDSLHKALAGFLKHRHHLFIVINNERETVGLITLEDVMEQLLGRRIVDEDDVYDDLRAVARREGAANNAGPGSVDV